MNILDAQVSHSAVGIIYHDFLRACQQGSLNRRIHITGHQLPSSFVFLRSRRQEFFVGNTGYSFHIRRNIYLHINLSSLITVYSLSYILCPVSFPSFQDMSTHFLPLMQSPFT